MKEPILYKIGRTILGPIFKWYYTPKIINKKVILSEGPILIVGNHKHLYDQCLSIISTKRVIHYMAKKEYFDSIWRCFFKSVGCISVDRENHDEKAVESAISILKENGAVGIFPEGTRNKTKKTLLPFKFGTVSMAKKTNATIIPFAIRGDYKFKSKNLTIEYGTPFKVENMKLEEANDKLYKEIERLINKK